MRSPRRSPHFATRHGTRASTSSRRTTSSFSTVSACSAPPVDDFDFDGADRRQISMRVCGRVVRDYQEIEYGPERRPLTPADTRAAHLVSREWLSERLAEPFDGTTVVVTHHQPLITGQPPDAALRAIAGAFVSDLSPLIGADREALWIFGHTHRFADLVHDGTRVLSNQRGYPHERVAGFDRG